MTIEFKFDVGDYVKYNGKMYKHLKSGVIKEQLKFFTKNWYRIYFDDVSETKSLSENIIEKVIINENN